jgi:hypothetical protein
MIICKDYKVQAEDVLTMLAKEVYRFFMEEGDTECQLVPKARVECIGLIFSDFAPVATWLNYNNTVTPDFVAAFYEEFVLCRNVIPEDVLTNEDLDMHRIVAFLRECSADLGMTLSDPVAQNLIALQKRIDLLCRENLELSNVAQYHYNCLVKAIATTIYADIRRSCEMLRSTFDAFRIMNGVTIEPKYHDMIDQILNVSLQNREKGKLI